jgi:nucleotide-binding universal stress UspA family protein
MGYRKILVPLDGSTLAEQVLKRLQTMAEPKARIHLLTVLGHDRLDMIAASVSAGGQPFSPIGDPWMANDFNSPDDVEDRKAYLKKAALTLTQLGFSVTTDIRRGEIADTIIQEASEGHFDVIAIATHGRTGFGRLLLGSVTQAILGKAPCPVLVLPPSKLLETLEAAQKP